MFCNYTLVRQFSSVGIPEPCTHYVFESVTFPAGTYLVEAFISNPSGSVSSNGTVGIGSSGTLEWGGDTWNGPGNINIEPTLFTLSTPGTVNLNFTTSSSAGIDVTGVLVIYPVTLI